MLKKIKKTRPKQEYYEREPFCDICGKSCKFNVSTMENETNGYNYGDSYGHTKEKFDICDECYQTKVVPLMEKELNLKPRIEIYSDGEYEDEE